MNTVGKRPLKDLTRNEMTAPAASLTFSPSNPSRTNEVRHGHQPSASLTHDCVHVHTHIHTHKKKKLDKCTFANGCV